MPLQSQWRSKLGVLHVQSQQLAQHELGRTTLVRQYSLLADRVAAAISCRSHSLGSSAVLGLLLHLVGGLFILFADLVELPHVLEEVRASLERDEKLGLLAVAPVVRGLNCDGLGSDFLESGVVVPRRATKCESTWE